LAGFCCRVSCPWHFASCQSRPEVALSSILRLHWVPSSVKLPCQPLSQSRPLHHHRAFFVILPSCVTRHTSDHVIDARVDFLFTTSLSHSSLPPLASLDSGFPWHTRSPHHRHWRQCHAFTHHHPASTRYIPLGDYSLVMVGPLSTCPLLACHHSFSLSSRPSPFHWAGYGYGYRIKYPCTRC
jgi:hypothetical protein